jgi:hypothetical protein
MSQPAIEVGQVWRRKRDSVRYMIAEPAPRYGLSTSTSRCARMCGLTRSGSHRSLGASPSARS